MGKNFHITANPIGPSFEKNSGKVPSKNN